MRDTSLFSNAWMAPVVYGVCLVLVSLMLFIRPLPLISLAVWTIGLFWLVGGIIKLIGLYFDRTRWGLKLIGGAAGVFVGAWIVFPASGAEMVVKTAALTSTLAYIWLFGGLFVGVTTIFGGLNVKDYSEALVGFIEVLLACFLISNVYFMLNTMVLIFAFITLFGGIASIYVGVKARKAEKMIFTK
ncbi:MAG: DUF308 domain-containing protein [Coriobacteriia bacterium]|nr:DUF308 domain-containing protein [Coriobacteriia bacterium]